MDMNELRITVSLTLDDQNEDEAYIDFILTVDGQHIHNPETDWVDPVRLVESANESGEKFIFTCSCGNPDCIGMDSGIAVTHQSDRVLWNLRAPMSWPPEEKLPDWTQDVEFVFDREAYVDAVQTALRHAKSLVSNWTAPGEIWVGPGLSRNELLSLQVGDGFTFAAMPQHGTLH